MPYHANPVNQDAPPPLPDQDPRQPLEGELLRLTPDQTDKLLGILRGLFGCVGELNQRLAEIERRIRS
ncbi:hypothetical protein KBB96_16410 [Luteolibacter ambystomatis]|uniref:Uncharacterized protein n=1 Tax=Luteolibacter ambystomatis TaxID=2824561 RepID=A0A975G7D6_9BACT|nr:hypothetical protein [Luteolibacter ambystomatis]QUE50439.1 hypothetical protein KBB96_16410 [Luteolibacter ambystomatis]